MSVQDHDKIVKRAHSIWEREGRPDGRAEEHWRMAVAELAGEAEEKAKGTAAGTKAAETASQPATAKEPEKAEQPSKTKTEDKAKPKASSEKKPAAEKKTASKPPAKKPAR